MRRLWILERSQTQFLVRSCQEKCEKIWTRTWRIELETLDLTCEHSQIRSRTTYPLCYAVMLNFHYDRHWMWLGIITYRENEKNIGARCLVSGSVRLSVVALHPFLLIIGTRKNSLCVHDICWYYLLKIDPLPRVRHRTRHVFSPSVALLTRDVKILTMMFRTSWPYLELQEILLSWSENSKIMLRKRNGKRCIWTGQDYVPALLGSWIIKNLSNLSKEIASIAEIETREWSRS